MLAVTDDDCAPDPSWLEGVASAFSREHPPAAVTGGCFAARRAPAGHVPGVGARLRYLEGITRDGHAVVRGHRWELRGVRARVARVRWLGRAPRGRLGWPGRRGRGASLPPASSRASPFAMRRPPSSVTNGRPPPSGTQRAGPTASALAPCAGSGSGGGTPSRFVSSPGSRGCTAGRCWGRCGTATPAEPRSMHARSRASRQGFCTASSRAVTGMSAGDRVAPVSVVIPSRERPGLLMDAVHSVLDGGSVPRELVVVDQSAAPNTELTALGDVRGCRIHYIHSATVGPSRGRNIGIAAATQANVVLIDDDMLVAHDWLAKLVEALPDDPRGVATGAVLPAPPEGGGVAPRPPSSRAPSRRCTAALSRSTFCRVQTLRCRARLSSRSAGTTSGSAPAHGSVAPRTTTWATGCCSPDARCVTPPTP